MRGIFRLNGTTYEDYDITLMCKQERCDYKNKILDNNWNSTIVAKVNSLVSSMPKEKIPKGSSVYLAPDSPYAVADVRKNYTIKRDFDTADYNVLKELDTTSSFHINIYGYAISDMDKKILIFNGVNGNFTDGDWTKEIAISSGGFSKQAVHNLLFVPLSYKPGYRGTKYYNSYGTLLAFKATPAHLALYDGKLTKPCVQYSALDLSSNLEVTQDILELVYNAGKQRRDENTLENFLLQLNTLNNYNWRDYGFTINMILNNILRTGNCVRNYIDNHLSSFPKQIRVLYNNRTDTFCNEKDFYASKVFLKNLLGLDGTKFTSIEKLNSKMEESGVPLESFNKVFNSMVKITEKEYEDALPF